jgi:putative ABC transport system permease protein
MNVVLDLAYAARTFRKKPAFALTAIITLALGIGAASAIFSVVNAVLLAPLPYDEPARLVHVCHDLRNRNVVDFPFAPADFHDLREQATLFDGVAGLVTGQQVIVNEGGEAERIRTGATTPNLFRLLGARIAPGSDFTDADGTPLPPQPPVTTQPGQPNPARNPPPPPRTILSHEFWQRRFGGNPAIVGTVVRLGEQRLDVIGVLEPGFELLFPPTTNVQRVPDVWTPLRVNFAEGSRINVFLRVVARLKPGVSIEQARGQVDAVAADLRARFPIKQTAGYHLRLEEMHEDLVADVRPAILALMGAVTFVLLIACANVANLLLVRAVARERELAVRAALGGSRGRLVRQLLTESLLLAGLAIALGLGLAWLGVRLLLSLAPENLPHLDHVSIDPSVAGFAAAAGLTSAIVFGLIPALRASRPDVMDLLRRAGRTGGLTTTGWVRNSIVTTAVALSFVLLVGSGLMIRSFVALQRAEPGYDPDGVLTFFIPQLHLPEEEARQAFMRELKTRIEALPGVHGATAASPLPLDGREGLARWGPEEALADASKFQQATFHFVLPGYFQVMRTRVIEGRTFTEADNTRDARVAVIDRVLAAKAFPRHSPIGQTLLARLETDEPERFQIIGVVEHQRHTTLARDGREAIYLPDGNLFHGFANRWAVRASGDLLSLAPAIRAAVADLNPRAGVIDIQPMQALVDHAQAPTRFALMLIGIFAAIALVLATVGLYSVLSTLVRQRTSEIGVRMAFGAAHGRIFAMMVGEGLRLSAVGIVVGLAAAFALTGAMRTMLVGVEPTDAATFTAMTVGFLIVAVVACGIPALRAARLDPMTALREE